MWISLCSTERLLLYVYSGFELSSYPKNGALREVQNCLLYLPQVCILNTNFLSLSNVLVGRNVTAVGMLFYFLLLWLQSHKFISADMPKK
jgi:hypothetical protein